MSKFKFSFFFFRCRHSILFLWWYWSHHFLAHLARSKEQVLTTLQSDLHHAPQIPAHVVKDSQVNHQLIFIQRCLLFLNCFPLYTYLDFDIHPIVSLNHSWSDMCDLMHDVNHNLEGVDASLPLSCIPKFAQDSRTYAGTHVPSDNIAREECGSCTW